MKATIADLQNWTGVHRNKLRTLLADLPTEPGGPRGARLYESSQALQAIYQPGTDRLDPAVERAKLDEARRLEIEARLAKQRGELLDAKEVSAAWSYEASLVRSHLLQLPSRAAPELLSLDGLKPIEDALRGHVYAALESLGRGEHSPDWPGQTDQAA
ncbi:MAG: hypothetical protein ACLFS2_10165 [Halochromatium sp.]|uniref:hypothetical protein n=1 Tax=Halochromatium sp. TaxID=2049430 RepID=UPI00397E02EA